MLVSFEFENFLSYKEKCFFSMNATKGTKHADHLNDKRILPVVAIFGGNGSGKSNFISAIDFSRSIIVDEESDNINFYNLKFRGSQNSNNIGKFKYTFYIENNLYSYEIFYNYMDRIIVEETLFNQKKKKIIYKRNISKKIEINEKLHTAKEKKFLDFYINDFEFDKKFKNTFLNYMATKNSNNLNFIEIISDTAFCYYITWHTRIIFYFFAQTTYCNVNRSHIPQIFIPPHVFKQYFS